MELNLPIFSLGTYPTAFVVQVLEHLLIINWGAVRTQIKTPTIFLASNHSMLSAISCKVPKNTGDKRSGKSETSPVAPRAGIQQKAQQQQQHKGNQALQVPAVALYPSRKKVPVKDLPPFGKWNSEALGLVL